MCSHLLQLRSVLTALVLSTVVLGCTSTPEDDFSCAELEERDGVELLLCEDGETRIDRRDELIPVTPDTEPGG